MLDSIAYYPKVIRLELLFRLQFLRHIEKPMKVFDEIIVNSVFNYF